MSTEDTDTNSQEEAPGKKPAGPEKLVAGKYEIDLMRSLTIFEHTYAEAYECTLTETGKNDHVAVVMKDRYPVRRDVLIKTMSKDFEGLMSLRQNSVVAWPDGSDRFVMVFKRPPGHPILQLYGQRREPLTEEIIKRGIVRPISQTLDQLYKVGIFHGNIQPVNIFMDTQDNAQAILRECASSIPGINQSVLYETIERGMADADGKGIGNERDDIYSLGATIAVLLRGHSPIEGKTSYQITEEKINRGSYALFTDGLRMSPALSEFLRATLNDDPHQRWDIEQLLAWVEGNRSTPKPTSMGARAQRHLDFNGKKYIRPRMLAKDLHENPTEAVTLIDSGNLTRWIERAIGDMSMLGQVDFAISKANTGGRTSGFEDRLLCYICMALDPQAPLRYKDKKLFPAGIGNSLSMAMLKGENIQTYGELIRERYAWYWLNFKENMTGNFQDFVHLYDHASKIIIRRGIDYGIERCLYELSPDVPCLSDMFKDIYIQNCDTLLYALNKISKSKKDIKLIDRHIASYISIRDPKDNSGLMVWVENSDAPKRGLATIKLFQQLQKRSVYPKLVGLAEALLKDAEAVAQRFKNVETKKDIMKQLPKEAATGNLTRLLDLVDSSNQVRQDETGFVNAAKSYSLFNHERDRIRMDIQNNPYYGFKTGRQVALFVSMIISAILIVCTLIAQLGDKTQ